MYIQFLFNIYVNCNKPEAGDLKVIKPNVQKTLSVFISEGKNGRKWNWSRNQ
jgi:hypothetical protein